MEQKATLDDVMNTYADDAVDYAKAKFEVELDFSEASVQQVEALLSQLHDALPKGFIAKLVKKQPTEQEMDSIIKMFGGYITAVMQRRWGGTWKVDSQTFPEQEVYTFEIKGHKIWPHFKVGKRIYNGAEDNVWHYYQVLKQDFETG